MSAICASLARVTSSRRAAAAYSISRPFSIARAIACSSA